MGIQAYGSIFKELRKIRFGLIFWIKMRCIGKVNECRSLERSFGEGFADHFSGFADILSSEVIGILDINFIDLIGLDIFLFSTVHKINLTRVITWGYTKKYVWTMSHPPVCIYSSATPLVSPLSLSLR